MTSLHFRVAALLVLGTGLVLVLATLAAVQTLRSPIVDPSLGPIARQLSMLSSLASTHPDLAAQLGFEIVDNLPVGTVETDLSQTLTRLIQSLGTNAEVWVFDPSGVGGFTAAVELDGGGWGVVEMLDTGPPPEAWNAFLSWIALVVVGSAGISIFAASRITRPLQLLQRAAGRVDSDGVLPLIPETGPAEVRATARSLNQLSIRLKTAMESRMRLVAAAGHDLRTPMTRMRLRAEFIADDEERAKWLADIEELDSIADSAIRLVREEASAEIGERLDIGDLVESVVRELNAQGQQASVIPGPSLYVVAKPLALKRALRNLIANAAIHGKGAEVFVERIENTAVVTITDQGPGIPEEFLPRVFEPFFRVDIGRRKTIPGAGLGLAIAKEIIERSRGSISLSNARPRGLRQTVRMPLAQSS